MSVSYNYNNPFAALAAKMPAVRLTTPPAWFFRFPPAPFPRTLSSPPDHPTLAHPFTVSNELYNRLLDGRVPFTIAIVYISVITLLNNLNKSRNYQPWAFSKTRLFKLMVISHNIILAVYSAWTFVGMFNALQRSVYNPYHEWGFAGTVDSFCKLNGPRGFGSAAVYNERNAGWSIANRFFNLGADGLGPDATDVGRIWNEGLAFYGWLFYLSKFYEVIDTLIIIAKGKKSSFLQTYHHAGAMICMWAGIRYMSPPIWMFVLVNSFIHSIMYSFYLCTAMGIRIPVWFKRTLTTLQITQFVVGVIYAFSHLFIEYQSPYSIATHHTPGSPVEDIVSDVSSVISTATATVTANLSAHIKKALLRAAGREGLAENVLNEQGRTFGTDAEKAAKDLYKRQITEYRDDLHYVHCLDTSGQAFAIWLNVVYLMPLTVLFVRFFIKSYLRRLERRRSSTTTIPVPIEKRAHDLRESFSDATKGTRRSVLSLGGPQEGDEDTDNAIDDTEWEEQKEEVKQEIKNESKKAWRDLNESANKASQQISQGIESAKKNAGPAVQKAEENVKAAAKNTKKNLKNVSKEVNDAASGSKEGMNRTLEVVKQQADSVKAQTEPILQQGLEKAEGVYESVKTSIVETKQSLFGESSVIDNISGDQVKKTTENVKEQASDSVQQGIESLQTGAESVSKTVQDTASSVKETVVSSIESATSGSTSHTESKSTSKAHASQNDGAQDSAEIDKNTDKGEATEQVQSSNDKEVEQESSKEQVRRSDPEESSQAESSTGDAKQKSASTVNSKSQNTKSKDVTSPKKSNQKTLNVKNTNDKKHVGKDVSHQKDSFQEPDSKKAVKKDLPEDTGAVGENSQGRQSFFKGERADALEKLKSASSEADDKVIPDDDDVEENPSRADKGSKVKKTKDHGRESQGNQDAFEETRSNALEKLKSATSQSKDDEGAESKPVEHKTKPSKQAKSKAAEESADADNSQDFEDQKESWIDVGDENAAERKKTNLDATDASKAGSEQPSFADMVKSDAKEQVEEAGNDKTVSASQHKATSSQSKNANTTSTTKQETKSSEVKQESGSKSENKSTSEPEWFERLTTSTDSPQKSRESFLNDTEESATVETGVSFADKLKESTGREGRKVTGDADHGSGVSDDVDNSKDAKSKGTTSTESQTDKSEQAEQDKIIAESKPIRNEVKDEAGA